MNKNIESRLKELRLTAPSPNLKSTVLSNALAAWRAENEDPILHMQFRQILALAASLVLFIGVIAFLNRTEERHMRMSLNSGFEKVPASSENINFLKEIGLNPEYVSAIAGIQHSQQPELKLIFNRLENELKM